MADNKIINVRIQQKYDSEKNWSTKNPVLLKGEQAFSSDKNNRYKVGDGVSTWSQLTYAKADLFKEDVTTALGYTPPTSNTWRGIQNNLTSESAIDSLSAAQGKILNDTKIGAVKANDYYGIAMPDGTSTGWIRTTSVGLLPYESGAAGNGHSSLGNNSWYFSKAYIDNIYGNLQGNAKTASKLTAARKIGNAFFDGSSDITLAQMGINNPIEITKADYEDLKKNNKIDMSVYYNIIDDYDSIDIINDEYISTNQVFSSSKIDSVYSKKSIIHSITLKVQNWVKKNDNYQYVLSVNGITEHNIIEINYSPVATADEINAYQKASLRDGGQSKNQGILLADILPTINIPITVVIRNDL